MPNVQFSFHDGKAKRKLRHLKTHLSKEVQDQTVAKAAWVVHRRLVQQTPKRWTGQTRRGWKVLKNAPSNYSVTNISKVMRFLELGTPAHGPVTAKALFIPLNRRAALAGPRGVFAGGRSFVFGKDYVFAKRVKGIKALKIVEKYRPFAEGVLRAMMRLTIRNIIASQGT